MVVAAYEHPDTRSAADWRLLKMVIGASHLSHGDVKVSVYRGYHLNLLPRNSARCHGLFLDDDLTSGSAIGVMIEAIRNAGYELSIRCGVGEFEAVWRRDRHRGRAWGDSMARAVAKAFVICMARRGR